MANQSLLAEWWASDAGGEQGMNGPGQYYPKKAPSQHAGMGLFGESAASLFPGQEVRRIFV